MNGIERKQAYTLEPGMNSCLVCVDQILAVDWLREYNDGLRALCEPYEHLDFVNISHFEMAAAGFFDPLERAIQLAHCHTGGGHQFIVDRDPNELYASDEVEVAWMRRSAMNSRNFISAASDGYVPRVELRSHPSQKEQVTIRVFGDNGAFYGIQLLSSNVRQKHFYRWASIHRALMVSDGCWWSPDGCWGVDLPQIDTIGTESPSGGAA